METIINIVLLLLAFAFAVGTSIIVAENKEQRYMRKLAKKREDAFPFNKHGTHYRDGDNT